MTTANAHSASKTILVLGDSLSAEYGLVRGEGWVSLLEKQLTAKNIHAQVINASISGETTVGGKTRLPSLMEKYHPDILIIELGGNDALRGLSLKASEDNFRAMISTAKKDKARIILTGMQIPPNYGKEYAQKFFSLYAKLAAEQKIVLVPFLLEGVADSNDYFQADRIHPVAKAHPVILNNVWQHLYPLLRK
ncbi:arylesterase [Undibacterium sp. WLX3042]|uniref:arylesterase n=1 Tax=Undibacterium sp. WLX3042 TaxID=3412686 RepID=UPI003C3012C6